MSVFQHPHLTRGIVKTPKGSFVVKRGLVDVPDDIGESLGWQPVDAEHELQAELSLLHSPDTDIAQAPVGRRSPSRPPSLLKAEFEARARLIRAKAASRRSRVDDVHTAE
jgi:hypothetical protein